MLDRRFVLNFSATVVSFAVNIGIAFLLTPYIVKSLGTAAYGFVGLACNFVNYAQLTTIALNAMAGRYIAINFYQGKIERANKYFSSVFFSNVFVSALLLLVSVFIVVYLEYIIDIPSENVGDVKLLFSLMFLNFFASVIFNIYSVATFIKNRLDLASVRLIVSNLIRAAILFFMFSFFSSAVWYVGFATLVATLFVVATNVRLSHRLTPELTITIKNFDIKSIKELVFVGNWNLLGRLGDVIAQDFDLLLSNIFINPVAMGLLSITKNIPGRLLGLFGSVNGIFAPQWTKLYAEKNKELLSRELLKSVRFMGLLTILPLACLFAYGDWFYKLWIPSCDAHFLYILTVIATLDLPFAMPQEAVQNIFTITNKVKGQSLFTFSLNIIVLLSLLAGLHFVETPHAMLLVLGGTRAGWNTLKALTFLPLYGAYCAHLKWNFFYRPVFLCVGTLSLSVVLSMQVKGLIGNPTWTALCLCCAFTVLLSAALYFILVFTKDDRSAVFSKFHSIRHR